MTADPFRIYTDVGKDGYPPEWHRLPHDDLGIGVATVRRPGIKHLVREQAGHRCIRCLHPYVVGESGRWIDHPNGDHKILPDATTTPVRLHISTCDDQCRHGGPVVYWTPATGPVYYEGPDETIATNVEAVWRVLTVHHLNGDKADCRWWNLCALCQRCHLKIQGKVTMSRVWPWEHSPWFRPFVAGYYASVYLGEELTRQEVEARLEELLALERVA